MEETRNKFHHFPLALPLKHFKRFREGFNLYLILFIGRLDGEGAVLSMLFFDILIFYESDEI